MKKFLIIGNNNAITYNDIFHLIKENKMWLGCTMNGSSRWFEVPDDYEIRENASKYKEENNKLYIFVNGVCWFSNINNNNAKPMLKLTKTYNADAYPKYDNYDAINVDKTANIPMDYDGVMGVPITFLHKYNPNQFEIVDARDIVLDDKKKNKKSIIIKDADSAINGKATYARIAIRRIQ